MGTWIHHLYLINTSFALIWLSQTTTFHPILIVAILLKCEEVGVVRGIHPLSGEVRSVTTALKVVEEVQEEVQEIKDEWKDEEIEGNGGLKVEEIRSSCDDHEMTRTSET